MARKKEYVKAIDGLVNALDNLATKQGIRDNYYRRDIDLRHTSDWAPDDTTHQYGYKTWWENLVDDLNSFEGAKKQEFDFEDICRRLGVEDE